MLHQIILKRGIDSKDVDQALLAWVFQGAQPNHPIVLKLLLKRTKVVPMYPELIREVREEEVLLEEKSQGTRELSTTTGNREKVIARTVHVEAGFSDDDSVTDLEPAGLATPDTNKPVRELGPTWLMAQVAKALTQLYHALMWVLETQAKVQDQGSHQEGPKFFRGRENKCCGEVGYFWAECPQSAHNCSLKF